MSNRAKPTIPAELIEQKIYLVRGHKVLLDSDLARLYGVPTSRLNEQVKRNRNRFPADFMFKLTPAETNALISQFAISNRAVRGGRRKPLNVFTEQGVAMLSSVLKSERAAQVNVAIMRTFVKLRALLATHSDLARRLNELEAKYDERFRVVFTAIRELMTPEPVPAKRRIGFNTGSEDDKE